MLFINDSFDCGLYIGTICFLTIVAISVYKMEIDNPNKELSLTQKINEYGEIIQISFYVSFIGFVRGYIIPLLLNILLLFVFFVILIIYCGTKCFNTLTINIGDKENNKNSEEGLFELGSDTKFLTINSNENENKNQSKSFTINCNIFRKNK